MLELIKQPWPWFIAGPAITFVMFLLLYFGKNFGVSGNLRVLCSIGGAGRWSDFFHFDWKDQIWNLVFIAGAVIGGFIAGNFLSESNSIDIHPDIIQELSAFGITDAGDHYLPQELFSWKALFSLRGMIMLVLGGFFVGFGARYAGGCTSGHAISGLSDLQIPSLFAVIGFFIGGLIMTFIFLPIILNL